MRKIIFALYIMVFGLMALGRPVGIRAQTPTPSAGMNADAMTPPSVQKSEYALPYPGILPDHPLYTLKKIRDAILDKLIVDPVRKTEFYLLQADKHLSMTTILVEKSKTKEAQGTIADSTGFMEKVVKQLSQMKSDKKPIPAYIFDRVDKSMVKHVEVRTELSQKADGGLKDSIAKSLETLTALSTQLAGLK